MAIEELEPSHPAAGILVISRNFSKILSLCLGVVSGLSPTQL